MQYYLDIETTGFNPEKDKVITIQFQKLDYLGRPDGESIILKEWSSSEETIVKLIYNRLFDRDGDDWSFIPIGQNLIFDLNFLFYKFRKYGLDVPSLSDYIYDKPLIDIKSSLVIANSLSFRGAGLDNMTNKKQDGRMIPQWYSDKKFDNIIAYIVQETESFLEFFNKLREKLETLKKDGKNKQ